MGACTTTEETGKLSRIREYFKGKRLHGYRAAGDEAREHGGSGEVPDRGRRVASMGHAGGEESGWERRENDDGRSNDNVG